MERVALKALDGWHQEVDGLSDLPDSGARTLDEGRFCRMTFGRHVSSVTNRILCSRDKRRLVVYSRFIFSRIRDECEIRP